MIGSLPPARPAGPARLGTAGLARRLGLYALLLAGAIVMLTPFAYMVGISFTPDAFVLGTPPTFIPASPTLDNYASAWNGNNFGQAFFNSREG